METVSLAATGVSGAVNECWLRIDERSEMGVPLALRSQATGRMEGRVQGDTGQSGELGPAVLVLVPSVVGVTGREGQVLALGLVGRIRDEWAPSVGKPR